MPDEINKKINYKIITADDLLKDSPGEKKEIDQKLSEKVDLKLEKKDSLPKMEEKPQIKKFLLIFLILIIVLVIGFLIIFFKYYKKQNKQSTSTQELTTSTAIVFPPPREIQPPAATSVATSTAASPLPTSTESSPLPTSTLEAAGEIIQLKDIETKIVQVENLNSNEFEKSIKQLLTKQEYPASIYSFNFVFQEKTLPTDYFLDYFIKPQKLSLEELKNNLTEKYAFLLYYSYTRKNPIIIFEVKNAKQVQKFNQNWEKQGMVEDLKTLFWGLDPGKPLSSFTSKKFNEISYRVLNFKNNYQLIWLVYKNYLIYSTSENGLKKVLVNLP